MRRPLRGAVAVPALAALARGGAASWADGFVLQDPDAEEDDEKLAEAESILAQEQAATTIQSLLRGKHVPFKPPTPS